MRRESGSNPLASAKNNNSWLALVRQIAPAASRLKCNGNIAQGHIYIWLYGNWVTPREPARGFLPVLIWCSLTASTLMVDAGKLAILEVVMANVVKKLPITERGYGVRCVTKSGRIFIISHCVEKGRFTLWEESNGQYANITTAKSPKELYDKVPWKE